VSASAGLVASDLRVAHRGQVVLDGVALTVARGEMVAVVGPSGSGKTSLLALLGGLTSPQAGLVCFDGSQVPVLGKRNRHGRAPRIGIVLQGHGLVPVLTAAENVEVVLQARGQEAEDVRARAAAALDRVLLAEVADRLAERLSGGQQQRVAVARALVDRPDLLLADEPTSELDEETRDHVVAELRVEAANGAAVVVATHDPDIVAACDRALRLSSGHLEPA
jgi:putative ABC transport system ATP-binding protein